MEDITKRVADVVLSHDLCNSVEVLVEEVLLVVMRHPLGHDGAAAAHDSSDTLRDHGNVLDENAGVDREIVDALLFLFLDYFEREIDFQVFKFLDASESC